MKWNEMSYNRKMASFLLLSLFCRLLLLRWPLPLATGRHWSPKQLPLKFKWQQQHQQQRSKCICCGASASEASFFSDFKIKCLCGFTILFTSTHSDSCTKGSRAGELLKIIAAQTTLENKYIIPLIRVEPPTSCHSHGTLIPAKGPSARLLMKIKRFSSGRKYEGSQRNEAAASAH